MTTGCDRYETTYCFDSAYNPKCGNYQTTIDVEFLYWKGDMRHRRNYHYVVNSDMPFNIADCIVPIKCDRDLSKLNDKSQIVEIYDVSKTVYTKGGDDFLIVMNPLLAVSADLGKGNDIGIGGLKRDTLHGGDGNDFLAGNGDNDCLYGDNGCDTLAGATGDDRLFGGAGADWLYGELGDDYLVGGTGSDVFAFTNCDYDPCNVSCDTIADFCRDDRIQLSGFGNLGAINGRWIKVVDNCGNAQIRIDADKSGSVDLIINVEGMNYRDFMRNVGTYVQFQN